MLKRLAALLFIFVLAGQVLSGVCVCLEGIGDESDPHAKMACCKREKSVGTSVSAVACCDAPCGSEGSDRSKFPGSQSESNVKIPAPVLAAVEKFINLLSGLPPNYASPPAIPKRAGKPPLRLSHPPNLYLQNHAFLI
jgi:hypothetical protein